MVFLWLYLSGKILEFLFSLNIVTKENFFLINNQKFKIQNNENFKRFLKKLKLWKFRHEGVHFFQKFDID